MYINNFKTFFTNLSIWIAIILVIFSLYYFYNLYRLKMSLSQKGKIPWNKGLKGVSWNTLPDGTVRTRRVNDGYGKFIKQNGEWIYQKKLNRLDNT